MKPSIIGKAMFLLTGEKRIITPKKLKELESDKPYKDKQSEEHMNKVCRTDFKEGI